MRMNFATGLAIGVLLASVLVLASTVSQDPSLLGSHVPSAGTVQYTAATTTVTSSSTTASSSVTNPVPVSNLTLSTISATTTSSTGAGYSGFSSSGTSQSALSSLSSSVNGRAPSSLAVIVNNPSQSLLLLLPVALAFVLGIAFYKTSSVGD